MTQAKSPYLTYLGGYNFAFIRDRAHLRAVGRGASFDEMLAEEMFAARQHRELHFGAGPDEASAIEDAEGSAAWYRKLATIEADACADECTKLYSVRDLAYGTRCFERAERYDFVGMNA